MSYKRIYHSMDSDRQVTAFWQIFDEYDPDMDVWQCSYCKEPYLLSEGNPADNMYHYCPNCGAMMVGYETVEWEDDDETV